MASQNALRGTQSVQDLYTYQPHTALAIIGVVAFIAIAIVHVGILIQYRTWFFWAMYIGLLVECIGYTTRVISIRNPTNINAFVISYLSLILAPSFLAAACYSTFGRIVWWITPPEGHRVRLLWCRTRFVTLFFIVFDLGSFFIQLLGAGAVGAAYASKDLSPASQEEKARNGLATLKFGLVLQLICFGMFVIIGLRFLVVSRRWRKLPLRFPARPGANWERLIWVVNIATTLITIRAVYRMIEFGSSRGHPNYLSLYEWPFWVFDAVPIIGVFILFAAVHPGRHLPAQFCCFWLNTRRLRNEAKSLPPNYHQAQPIERIEGGMSCRGQQV